MEYRLCPSILSADFNRLGEQIQTLEKAEELNGFTLMLWMEILCRVFRLECR